MKKITPFLWFDNNAEQAIDFYLSIFKNGRKINANRFEIEGQEFMVLNGGPMFKFNEAISLFVDCKDQQEVDELWSKLTEGGSESRCGWLKDKFGLSWQIIPTVLSDMLYDEDPVKAARVMDAMLTMGKIDIAAIIKAYQG